MTSTLGDAPDWQGYSQWRASEGTKISTTISIGNPYKSQVVVTNWASFNLYAVLISGTGFTIIVTWFNDAAYSQVVDQQEWVLNTGNILNVTLPCLTPYAEIEYATAESGNQTILSYFTPQNLAVTKATYLTENNTLLKNNLSLGAGANVQYQVPYVMVGRATLTLIPADNSGKLYAACLVMTEAGIQQGACGLAYAPSVALQSTELEFSTPACPLVAEVVNTDADNAHSYYLYYQGLSQ